MFLSVCQHDRRGQTVQNRPKHQKAPISDYFKAVSLDQIHNKSDE